MTQSVVGTCPKCKLKVGIVNTLIDGWTMTVEAKTLVTTIETLGVGSSINDLDPHWRPKKHRVHKCKLIKDESSEFKREAFEMLYGRDHPSCPPKNSKDQRST